MSMARIAGVIIPAQKPVAIGLTYIYGIGRVTAEKITQQAQVDGTKRIKDLTNDEENRLRTVVEKQHRVEGELRRDVMGNIKRLKEINSYRGLRHAKNLPARGQRTKSNSRTVRGNRRNTAGSGRRIVSKT